MHAESKGKQPNSRPGEEDKTKVFAGQLDVQPVLLLHQVEQTRDADANSYKRRVLSHVVTKPEHNSKETGETHTSVQCWVWHLRRLADWMPGGPRHSA